MKTRNRLFAAGLAVWALSTVVIGGSVFVGFARSSPSDFHAAWSRLWIGAMLALPLAALVSWRGAARIAAPVKAMLEMSQSMLEGKFRERFFPDTYTEIDALGSNLNQLAASLRARVQDLLDSNAKLAAILDASVSGIVIFDSEGAVSAVNRSAQALLGRSGDELRGLPFPMALASSDLSSLVYKALYHRTSGREEVTLGRAEPKVVEATAMPVTSRDGQSDSSSLGVVLTLHDLTEIRRLERMRTDFVQNISHELRTPVTVVKGFAETLRDIPPADLDSVKGMADLIDKEASRLARLVSGLLDLAKLESGSFVPKKVPLDPARLLSDTTKKLEPLSGQRGQVVRVEAEVSPDSTISGDPVLLDMVFTNLIENAIKYAGDGGTIEVGVRPDQGGWLFWVKDNGPGISEEDLPRIFERFYRGSKDRSRDTGGSGLGLAIVKHCVTLHSGKVWVQSKAGRGTEFYVWLPA